MRPAKIDLVPIKSVIAGSPTRLLNEAKIQQLMESIRAIGLQTPLSVLAREDLNNENRDGWGQVYHVVAGFHRYEALRRLGWVDVPIVECTLEERKRRIWQIDENLCRAELSDADRAAQTAERARIWLDFRTGQGEPESSANCGGFNEETPSARGRRGGRGNKRFAKEVAEKTGRSQDAVQRDLNRGNKIAPDVLAAVKGTDIDKGVELDAIAGLPHDQQRQAVAMVRAGEAKTAREAKRKLDADPAPTALIEAWMKATKAWGKLLAAWELASETDRDAFCRTPAVEDWTPAQPWVDWKSRTTSEREAQ